MGVGKTKYEWKTKRDKHGNTETRDYLQFLGEDYDHKQTPAYIEALTEVKRIITSLPIITYGSLSVKLREKNPKCVQHLDDVLIALNDERILSYDPYRPAPSTITRGNIDKRGKVKKHLFNGGRTKERAKCVSVSSY